MHTIDPVHTTYCSEEEEKGVEGEVRCPLLYSFTLTLSIDLNENDICDRITFPFITAVDKSNATYTTIDHTGMG